jgi:K+-sensing histidine kinase KdpD
LWRVFADPAHAEVTPGQYTMISVTDTGIGMTPEVMGQAFDSFTTKAPGKGTGLGLSQVLGFVKQSKGHVKIYFGGRPRHHGQGLPAPLHRRRADGRDRRRGRPAAIGAARRADPGGRG